MTVPRIDIHIAVIYVPILNDMLYLQDVFIDWNLKPRLVQALNYFALHRDHFSRNSLIGLCEIL